MARDAGQLWMEHGALSYFECLGEDLAPDVGEGEIVTFPELAGAGGDETVVFAFIVFESRDHRDEVNAAVMEDASMTDPDAAETMPFDEERMAYGGFETIVAYEE